MSEPKSEQGKKQFVLRLSPKLHQEIAAWAQDDFRSLNGQIEFLLTQALRRRGRKLASDDTEHVEEEGP